MKNKETMKSIIKEFKGLTRKEKLELLGQALMLVLVFGLMYVGLWLVAIIEGNV